SSPESLAALDDPKSAPRKFASFRTEKEKEKEQCYSEGVIAKVSLKQSSAAAERTLPTGRDFAAHALLLFAALCALSASIIWFGDPLIRTSFVSAWQRKVSKPV